jgi:hypothetical protein
MANGLSQYTATATTTTTITTSNNNEFYFKNFIGTFELLI